MAGWDILENLLKEELVQLEQEGYELGDLKDRFEAARGDTSRLQALYDQTHSLPMRADFPYVEPSDLETIRKLRPDGPRRLPAAHSLAAWQDRFYGAWLGRCAGCALGKPLESWHFMSGLDGRPGWRNVQLWFEGADAFPITGYVPEVSRASEEAGLEISKWNLSCTREHIRHMVSDDDIRYTVLGLVLLEEKGAAFDTWDVGKLWHNRLTYGQVCTAETQAYLNFAYVTSHAHGNKPDNWREKLAWVRRYRNPYREWIGAQIRADGWAYGAAANPELAADFAWRDASLSHIKNGIYGEMFVAAIIAAAFVEPSVERLIEIGLSEIPANCRLAEDIHKAVEIAFSAESQLDLVEKIWNAFCHYNAVHTNNNAALVAASLLWAGDDFEKAITTAVLGGWDTDCNGATVGSIMGAKLGADALPQKWIAPLNDTLYADLTGFDPQPISACARRSYEVFRKINAS